ncbi:lipopolysaccharide biosynthesis protein [Solitalea lacus]|uniref:lipopolysaccharide biosynthesis protein n=1 Tax=Solitalea lacus TaxID=2911172 RepID=UPI001EDBD419|nr:oligosaccharide flippase family protein [Solitalea lacus]UKJ08280.1 oligosaccharide flippase family protein [Solitalea lacus]
MSTLKKFAGQTAIYGLSNIATRILNFFLTPLYTKIYSQAVYGIFTNLYSYASIINAILAFGMETTYFRFLNKEKDKDKVYSNSFWSVTIVAVAFLFLGLSASRNIADWLQSDSINVDYLPFVRYFVWILAIDAICVIPFAKLRADDKAIKYAFVKVINIGTFIGLNLFFIFIVPLLLKHHWPGYQLFVTIQTNWVGYVFLANLIASIVTLLLLLPEIAKVQAHFSWQLLTGMLSYSWPILIANLSFIINENLDKILLDRYLSLKEVGIYGSCCKLAIFMNIFIQAFRLGAEPFFFSHAHKENATKTYATIMHYFIITICVINVGLMANIDILKHFIDSKFWVGLSVVPILLFAYVCLGIYMNLSVWYKLSDQTRYGLYISAIGAILTIGLNVLFIPKYSFMASAWTSLVAYLVMMVISYVLGQKNYPIPYQLKDALIYIGMSVVMVILLQTVFGNNIFIRNLMVITLLAFAFIKEKDNFKKLIKA